VLKIPLHAPHVPQFHVAHIAHAIDAHPANHADDSQILFLSMDNTPASAECFEHRCFAVLDDHTESVPAAQLFRGLVRPCHGVLQTQSIGAYKRLRLADPPVWAIRNPYNLPTADRDAVRLNFRAQHRSVVGAFVVVQNDSPQWREPLTRDLQQYG
jgi:hypothetical protein